MQIRFTYGAQVSVAPSGFARLRTERSVQYLAAERDYVIQGHDSLLIYTRHINFLRCG